MNTVFISKACLAFFLHYAWLSASTRLLFNRAPLAQRDVADTPAPIHAGCGEIDIENELASALQRRAKATYLAALTHVDLASELGPFVMCRPSQPEVLLPQISHDELKYCALGKLAKNGNFFVSEDGVVLAKRIDKLEAQVVKKWGSWAASSEAPLSQYAGGCHGFGNTLLVPILISFTHHSAPYIAMPNLTHYYARAAPNDWVVQAKYDAKPLPNLGEGLVKLVKHLVEDGYQSREKIREWEAWEHVRSQLSQDLNFLKDQVVDFSLFVHVMKRKSLVDISSVPLALSPSKGCVLDPSKTTLICFRILDYLTPLTWKRELESQYKASKFDDYAEKFLLAFDCIGDVSQENCTNYQALASISEARDVSKAMAKSVFLGVKAFSTAYTCTPEVPRLQYKQIYSHYAAGTLATPMFGKKFDVMDTIAHEKEVGKEVVWQEDDHEGNDAKSLQAMASMEAGTKIIKDFCDGSHGNLTDLECTKIALQYAFDENTEERPRGVEYVNLDACAKMVNEFSTEGYSVPGDEKADMHNVLWAPAKNRLIAVRGLPKVPVLNVSAYVHKSALERGLLSNCFLKMQYLRCEPEDSQGVYFNYKQHFGALEVMVLHGGEYSRDLDKFAEAATRGVKIVHELSELHWHY